MNKLKSLIILKWEVKEEFIFQDMKNRFWLHTCSKKATTITVIKSVAVSKSLKFKSIGWPIIHPVTTQKGICIDFQNEMTWEIQMLRIKQDLTFKKEN